MPETIIGCPTCGAPISPAAILGQMNRGKHKHLSDDDIARRRARMVSVRAARKPPKKRPAKTPPENNSALPA